MNQPIWLKHKLELTNKNPIAQQPKCSKGKNKIVRICIDQRCKALSLMCSSNKCQCSNQHQKCSKFINYSVVINTIKTNATNLIQPILSFYQQIAHIAVNQYNQILKMQDYYLTNYHMSNFISSLENAQNINLTQSLILQQCLQPNNQLFIPFNNQQFYHFIQLQQFQNLKTNLTIIRNKMNQYKLNIINLKQQNQHINFYKRQHQHIQPQKTQDQHINRQKQQDQHINSYKQQNTQMQQKQSETQSQHKLQNEQQHIQTQQKKELVNNTQKQIQQKIQLQQPIQTSNSNSKQNTITQQIESQQKQSPTKQNKFLNSKKPTTENQSNTNIVDDKWNLMND